MPFDPTATPASLTPGQNITSDTETLYAMLGLSDTEGEAPVLLERAKPAAGPPSKADVPVMTAAVKRSLGQTIQGLYNLTPIQRAAVQKRLLSSGFYSSTQDLLQGEPDNDTVRAYATAAKRAVITGKTLDEVIDESTGAVTPDEVNKALLGGATRGGRTQAPFSPTTTNPLDVRDTAQVVATRTLGRKFTDAELSHFVNSFQQMQLSAQQSQYTADTAGGRTVAAPDVAAAAEAQARAAAPAEAGAHDLATTFAMFQKIIGG